METHFENMVDATLVTCSYLGLPVHLSAMLIPLRMYVPRFQFMLAPGNNFVLYMLLNDLIT